MLRGALGAVAAESSEVVRTGSGRSWVAEGRWEPCPAKPGCICSQRGDPGEYMSAMDGWEVQRLLTMECGWSRIADAVYCICLQERDDRFGAACDEAHRTGLCRLVRFYRPRKPTDQELARASSAVGRGCEGATVKARGFFGSWESHRAVAAEALSYLGGADGGGGAGRRALVLEDDFRVLERARPGRLGRVAREMRRLPAGWEVFYLGHMPAAGYPVASGVFRTWSCWVHAYVLSPAGQRRVAALSYVDNAVRNSGEQTFDGFVMGNLRQYAAFPQLVVQSAVGSDNLTDQGDLWKQFVEWWTRVHRDHSLAIECAVLLALPVLLAVILLLLLTLVAKRLLY